MTSTTAPAALPLPTGFTADDTCPSCSATGLTWGDVIDEQGEPMIDEQDEAVQGWTECGDCEGVGYSAWVEPTPADLRLARRRADHEEFVAEFGVGASCSPSAAWCRHL